MLTIAEIEEAIAEKAPGSWSEPRRVYAEVFQRNVLASGLAARTT